MPVSILLFAGAGANLHLDILSVVDIPAVFFVLVRGVQRFAGFRLLPQAGLALALSMLFANMSPDFGAEAGAINEVVAPALYRFALVRSEEAGRKHEAPVTPEAQPSPAPPLSTSPAA